MVPYFVMALTSLGVNQQYIWVLFNYIQTICNESEYHIGRHFELESRVYHRLRQIPLWININDEATRIINELDIPYKDVYQQMINRQKLIEKKMKQKNIERIINQKKEYALLGSLALIL
jgi:hypothetical protein